MIWIAHWEYLLKNIEGEAFGKDKEDKDIKVLRDWTNKRIGAKTNALQVWGLFFVLWILSILYFIIAICVKCNYR